MERGRLGLALASSIVLTGCISAMSHPVAPDAVPQSDALQTFTVSRGGYLFGGHDGVLAAMHEKFPRARESDQYDAPAAGTFVRVRTRDLEMSLAGKIYGYVSLSLFTLIPFYNGETGCDVVFEVFDNGKMLKTYAYPIHRHLFVWLGVLPFSWISALTPSEFGAAHDAAYRFFADAARDGVLR
jgi:hypothetical protein